jgi:co-chaperonin GroES (HSP10)
MMGKVVAVGSGLYTQSGVSIPMSTKVGDIVLLDGTEIYYKNGGKTYNIYRESEFLSILDEV